MKYIFGPVHSRRLGFSLGVDLVPYKTCSANCVYCECGKTTILTTEIKEYVPTAAVIKELHDTLQAGPNLDVITFAGSGEPTLHSGIAEIIDFIKQNYPAYKIAVLTNGTLFWDEKVRSSIHKADIVIPSIDAISEVSFTKIIRPHPDITLAKYLNGIQKFSSEFKGKLIIEAFIIPEINDSDTEIQLLKQYLSTLNPSLVQLNSLDRPGTEEWVKSAPLDLLLKIKDSLAPLPVEVIKKLPDSLQKHSTIISLQDTICNTLKRRPSTIADLCNTLGANEEELQDLLESLIKSKKIKKTDGERGAFYSYIDQNNADS